MEEDVLGPPKTYIDQLEEPYPKERAERMMEDRDGWRRFIMLSQVNPNKLF